MKICSKCGVEKSREAFYATKQNRDGLYSRCKPCHNNAVSQWAAKNKERVAQKNAERYARDKERILAVGVEWAKKNADKIRVRRLNLRHKNPEKYAAQMRRQRAMNPERYREISIASYWATRDARLESLRRYKERNPDVVKRHEVLRRVAKESAIPDWSVSFFVAEAYRLAKLRTQLTGVKWDVDHVVPIRSSLVCGLHAHTNLQVVPRLVNQRKSNRYWPDMP